MRIAFQQPSLAQYRIPFFSALQRIDDFDILVAYSERAGLPNSDATGFSTQKANDTPLGIVGKRLFWNSAQWALPGRDDVDVLVLPANLRYLSLYAGIARARRRGIPVVLWGHHLGKSGSGTIERLRQKVLTQADSIVCYGFHAADKLKESGLRSEKVYVAPNAIDQDPIRRAAEVYRTDRNASKSFRKRQGLGDRMLVLFIGRPKPRNRIDRFVNVIAELSGKGYPIDGVVIGKRNEYLGELQRKARQLDIEHRMHFPGELYSERELAPWFCESFAMYFPEQIGLSAHHAMGYGLPVVAGKAPHANNPELELIQDGYNGFIHEASDISAAAESLEKLFLDESLRRSLGDAAELTVSDTYSMDEMVLGFANAIRYAAEKKS